MNFNMSDLDVYDSYEADQARNGEEVFKIEEQIKGKSQAKSLLAVIYETHEADELADAKIREEMRNTTQTTAKKARTISAVWEAVEEDEIRDFYQSF